MVKVFLLNFLQIRRSISLITGCHNIIHKFKNLDKYFLYYKSRIKSPQDATSCFVSWITQHSLYVVFVIQMIEHTQATQFCSNNTFEFKIILSEFQFPIHIHLDVLLYTSIIVKKAFNFTFTFSSQPWLQGTCIVAYMPHSCKRLYFTNCYQKVDIVRSFALIDRYTQVSGGLNDDSLWCEWWWWWWWRWR